MSAFRVRVIAITRIKTHETDQSKRQASDMNVTYLMAMFDLAIDATLLVDSQGRIVMANAAAQQLWGSGSDTMVGTAAVQWLPAWHLAKSHADSSSLDQGLINSVSRALPSQFIGLRGDGQRFAVEVEHSRLDVEGATMYSLVARKTSMLGLEWADHIDRSARLIASMASGRDAACIADTEGGLVHFNEAFASLQGFKSREHLKREWPEHQRLLMLYTACGKLVPPDSNPVSSALRGQVGMATDYTVRHQGTAELSAASCDFAPIRDRQRAIVGAVVILRRTEPGGAAYAQAALKKHVPPQGRFDAARHDRTTGKPRRSA
jgi:PAS domain S-box-containing protein